MKVTVKLLLLASIGLGLSNCSSSSKIQKKKWSYKSRQGSNLSLDSSHIILKVYFQSGCTESETAFVNIRSLNQSNSFKVHSIGISLSDPNPFIISKDLLFTALNQYENEASTKKGCGGLAGGTGVTIEKHFNEKITYSNYCQEYGLDTEKWNGLAYFFALLGKKTTDLPFMN